MSNLLELLSKQLGSEQINTLSNQLGASQEQTQQAISAALPALLGFLGKHADSEEGAQQIHSAISKAEVVSPNLMDQLGGLLGGSSQGASSNALGGLLSQVLGGNQDRVANAIGKSSGLNTSQVGSLLQVLGPMVLSTMGTHQKQNNMSSEDLTGMLRYERQAIEKSPHGSFLGSLLDQDGDGDFDLSDVMKLGMNKLFGRK